MDARRLLSFGLVAVLVGLTTGASLLVLRRDRVNERARAQVVADDAQAVLTGLLRRTELALSDVASADEQGDVAAATVTMLTAATRRDGVADAVGWAPRVRASERSAFEDRLGAPITAQLPDASLGRQGDAAEYLPIFRISPPSPENRRGRGFDQFAEPIRARAARSARDSGRTVLTAPIVFVTSQGPGVTMFRPLYVRGARVSTLRERRRAFAGVLGAGLSIDRLRTLVLADLARGVSFSLRDGETTLVPGPAKPRASTTVAVYGRRWTLGVSEAQRTHTLAVAIAVGGGLLALLTAVGLTFGRRRTELLAARRSPTSDRAERDALLLDVGRAVDTAGSMADATHALAELLAHRLGDVCLIDQIEGVRGVRRVAAAGVSSELADIVAALGDPAPSSGQARVIADGQPMAVPAITDEMVKRISGSEAEVAVRRRMNLRSSMILPLAAQGVVTGALTIGRRAGHPPFTATDLPFGIELAQRVSLVLDNARLYETEHEIATTLQEALLPVQLETPPGLEVAVRYRPAGNGVMVGGDFYDVIKGAEGWVAVVGDVRGKGPRAAAVTAIVRHTLRARLATDGIADALRAVNAALVAQHDDELFCSLAAVEVDLDGRRRSAARVRVAVAGHPPPLLLRADGAREPVSATGWLLGPFEDPHLHVSEHSFGAGDTLLLVTDGVTEARRRGAQFGDDGLNAAVAAAPRGSLQGLLTQVELEAVAFAAGQPQDDIALLGIRLATPAGSPVPQVGERGPLAE